MVHTCPRCELRFELAAEVADHLVRDHRFEPESLQPHFVPAPKAGRRLVVVVGNHTLLADALRERLRAVVAGGDVDLHVVVPVRSDDELDIGFWRGRALAERIPYSLVALLARLAVAGVFWRSGQTKVEGLMIKENTFFLFREEYKVPLLPPDAAGKAIKGNREKYTIATKCGIIRTADGKMGYDGSRKHVREALEASLKRLGVDYVDLYYLHRLGY